MTRHHLWTAQEMQFIADNYRNMSDSTISEKLNRTPNQVKMQRTKQGLRKYDLPTEAHPVAAVIHKAPPSTDAHAVEPTPEVIPGLMYRGCRKSPDSSELIAIVDARKRMFGTYNNPVHQEVHT